MKEAGMTWAELKRTSQNRVFWVPAYRPRSRAHVSARATRKRVETLRQRELPRPACRAPLKICESRKEDFGVSGRSTATCACACRHVAHVELRTHLIN
nr:hypothetical protein BaRGS_022736 [Batillaria attramentaria]